MIGCVNATERAVIMANTRFKVCDITGRVHNHFSKEQFDNAVRFIEDCNAYCAKDSVKPYFIVDNGTHEIITENAADMATIAIAIKKGACRI